MLDLFQSLLHSPGGSFAFIASLMAIAFLAVWKVSHFSTKFSSVTKLEESIDSIKTDMHYVKGFIQLYRETNNPLAQRQSPVSLTQIGKDVSSELKLEKMVMNHWDAFCSAVTSCLKKNCNPYDIQVESFKVGDSYQKFISQEELLAIKTHAFSAGYNLDIYNLLFGIIIREKILKDKGFREADIDLHDPSIPTY